MHKIFAILVQKELRPCHHRTFEILIDVEWQKGSTVLWLYDLLFYGCMFYCFMVGCFSDLWFYVLLFYGCMFYCFMVVMFYCFMVACSTVL